MPLAETPQARTDGYRQHSQAAVEKPEAGVGKTAAPRTDAESEPLAASLAPAPRGHFISTDYEADCARFLLEAKGLARRRAQALLVPRPSWSTNSSSR
jgi:hypothetical protein